MAREPFQIMIMAGLTVRQVTLKFLHFSSIIGPLSLHWLPVRCRIQFKINLLTYKVYKTACPVYLKDCVQPYSTKRSESVPHMLHVPYYYKQHKSFTHLLNSFFYSAPRLWNWLPVIWRCANSVLCLKAYLWTRHVLLRFFSYKFSSRFRIIFLFTDNDLDYP